MALPTGQVIMPTTKGITYGSGSVKSGLLAAIQQLGASRVFLVCTPSLAKSDLYSQLRDLLGEQLVGEFCESVAHTPESVVERAVAAADSAKPDLLVSFGGSSVIDLAKAIALVMAEGNDYPNMKISFSPETGPVLVPLLKPKLPHIAIPTTLSSAEFTFAVAITDEAKGEKNLFADAKLTPAIVFQDPLLCEPTPSSLWSSSGMKILADCVEMLCSPRAMPITDAFSMKALELLFHNLGPSVDASKHEARSQCMLAGFMVMSYALNAGIGMVAALRHQLGGGEGVSHGEASSIVLPHVLRWNLPNIKERLAMMATQLKLADASTPTDEAALKLIEGIETLTTQLSIPTRLSKVGVSKDALKGIADHAAGDISMATNPRPSTAKEILAVLEAAY